MIERAQEQAQEQAQEHDQAEVHAPALRQGARREVVRVAGRERVERDLRARGRPRRGWRRRRSGRELPGVERPEWQRRPFGNLERSQTSA